MSKIIPSLDDISRSVNVKSLYEFRFPPNYCEREKSSLSIFLDYFESCKKITSRTQRLDKIRHQGSIKDNRQSVQTFRSKHSIGGREGLEKN
jgi:hypothetical protein